MCDYYEELEVSPNASPETITAAYKSLCKRFHPDVAAENHDERMKAINEAYSVLSDPDKRRVYEATILRDGASQNSYHPETNPSVDVSERLQKLEAFAARVQMSPDAVVDLRTIIEKFPEHNAAVLVIKCFIVGLILELSGWMIVPAILSTLARGPMGFVAGLAVGSVFGVIPAVIRSGKRCGAFVQAGLPSSAPLWVLFSKLELVWVGIVICLLAILCRSILEGS